MNQSVPVSILRYRDQLDMAERELSAFCAAVETLFGPEQAKISAGDWLDATERVLGPNQPSSRDWRAVTIAASSRLAHRLAVGPGKRASLITTYSAVQSSPKPSPILPARRKD
jgi:hypothetical protein